MAFQARNRRAVIAADVGAEHGQLSKPLQIRASQIDLIVPDGHGLRAAERQQFQSAPAPVGLYQNAFQIQKVTAVKIQIRFFPMVGQIGADPAQEGEIRMDVVGVIDIQTHSDGLDSVMYFFYYTKNPPGRSSTFSKTETRL